MAEIITSRRVSYGDAFFTDWFSRSGDSMLLRAECIVDNVGFVNIEVQTRAEPGPGATDSPSELFTLTPT
jgi:hypothetical protein